MSYDLFIFRPKAGVSPEWINEFLESNQDETADPEEIHAQYIDMATERDELSALVAVPLIRAICNQEFSQEEVEEYLEEPEYGTELSDCMEIALEYHEGYQILVTINYTGTDRAMPERMWDAFEELHDRGLVVYDPQLGRLLDMKDDHEEFVECMRDLGEEYDELMDDEDDYGYGDEDDEEY